MLPNGLRTILLIRINELIRNLIMISNQKKYVLSLSIKYTLQAILITLICSPLFILAYIFFYAVRTNNKYWSPNVEFGVYCIAPIAMLIFFSLPYLGGGYVLGLLKRRSEFNTSEWLGAFIGAFSGSIGLSLIILQQKLKIADIDWIMVIVIELWSIMIFRWTDSRINNAMNAEISTKIQS